jgi:hypothetical protein
MMFFRCLFYNAISNTWIRIWIRIQPQKLDPKRSGSATLSFYDNISELPTCAGWGEDGDSHHDRQRPNNGT